MSKIGLIILICLQTGYVVGKFLERNRWEKTAMYALYDRDKHLSECTRHFPLVLKKLKPGETIVAGHRRVE